MKHESRFLFLHVWITILLILPGISYSQVHVISGGNFSTIGPINLQTDPSWTTSRTSTAPGPGFFEAVAPNGSYTMASDMFNINGYLRHISGNPGQGFNFPVGSGTDLRQVTTSGTIGNDIRYATAWILGDPTATGDPTDGGAFHPVTSLGAGIAGVSTIGQWDWVENMGSTAGMTVTVSIPAILPAFASNAGDLRLVGWNGMQWVNLSTAGASGLTENSTLTGTMIAGITALGIGLNPCETFLPVDLTTTSTANSITVTWVNKPNFIHYNLEIFLGGIPLSPAVTVLKGPGTTQSFTFSNLAPCATYTIRVTGICQAGSVPVNVQASTIQSPEVPTVVTEPINFSCTSLPATTIPASWNFRWTHEPSTTPLYWFQIKNAAGVVVDGPVQMANPNDTVRAVTALPVNDLTRTLEVWSGNPALPTSCLLGRRSHTATISSVPALLPADLVEPVVMFDECLPMAPITDAVFTLTDCGGIDTTKITIRVNDSLFRRSVHLEPTYRAAILPGQGSFAPQLYTVDLLAMRPAGRYIIEFTYVGRDGNTITRKITKELRKMFSPALAMTCISFQQWSLSDSCRTTGDTVKVTNMMTVPLCPEAFKVFFKGTKNLAILNKSHIGKTVTVEVLHEGSGQKCWGDIFVEDKVPAVCLPTNIPVFTISCDSVEIYKAHTATTTIRPAKVRDNCGLKDSVLTIHDFSTKCGGHLIRRWTYTDCGGMVTHCEQRINIVNNNQFVFPQDTILVECGVDVSPNGLYNYLRDKVFNNVTPTISRDSLAGRKSFVWIFTSGNRFGGNANDKCGLLTTWSDVEFTLCLPADRPDCKGTSRKILRKWDVIDWCTGRTTPRTQIIVSADTRPPSFKVDNITVSTRPWDCTADVWMPAPRDLHDNCDFDPRWVVKADQDPLKPADIKVVKIGDNWRATGVPCGTFKFKYIATDCCGNDSLVFMNVTVTDRTAPNAITKQDIVISLVPGYKELNEEYDAQAKLFAASVDNGSHDNCSPNVLLEVRRPTGGSCGNLGGNNHNNNRSFRNFPNQPATATTPAIAGWNEPRGTGANNTALFTANRFTVTERSRQFYNENDTDGGAFVKFCCDDIPADADFGIHEVIMRVWDDGNKNGVVGDPGDNYNETWANVRLDCKVPPVISCPPNLTIPCDWEIPTSTTERDVAGFDFSKTKFATAYGACGVKPVRFVDKVTNGNCGAATIERTFIVTDKGYRVTCTQIITVTAGTPDWVFFNRLPDGNTSTTCPTVASGNRRINHYEHTIAPVPARTSTATTNTADLLNLACDIEKVTVCNLTVDSKPVIDATPTYRQGPCDVIGLNKKIWEIEFEEGVCKKWVVDYKFVNWCDQKEITYRKMFVFEDLSAPKIVCQDTCIAAAADCKTSFTIRKSADDLAGCADITDRRWLKWQVFIDEWADGTVDRIYSSFVAPNWNFGTGQVINYQGRNVPAKYLAPSVPGSLNNGIDFTNIEGKHSFHNVTWKVTDGCHNYASCQETIEVRDKKAPTPYCVNLSTALMAVPAGAAAGTLPMVELWAKDFDKASFDGCTPSKDLLFTFNGERPADTLLNVRHIFTGLGVVEAILEGNRTSSAAVRAAAMAKYNAGTAQIWIPATRSSGRVWTSAALQGKASNEVQVNVSVWDWALNTDFCMVNLKLVCNGNGCPTGTGTRIAGNVHTEDGKNVMDVRITASASIPEYPKYDMTNVDGNFSMEIVTDTELKAEKDGDDINGVSTLDLVMLQRHILGLENLNSPYKLIAADANNDGKISAADITEIRKLILGLSSAFEYNSSWRFPIEKQFMNKDNPFPYLETMIARYGETDNKYNFMAVKIGDVNGNASSGIFNPYAETRNNNTLTLAVEEKQLAAGDVVEISVTAANFNDVTGFQYTMNLKGASFQGIIPGTLDMTDKNVGVLSKNMVTMSYSSHKGISVAEDEVLFTLLVKADQAVKVSEMLSLGSAVTPAEAYNSDLKVGKVSLDVRTAPVTAIELMQNEPNPFMGQTTVNFMMPEAAAATLSVYDVTGQLVSVRNINAVKGLNSEIFTREQLGASGVMYYTLKSGDFTATKKMIVIE